MMKRNLTRTLHSHCPLCDSSLDTCGVYGDTCKCPKNHYTYILGDGRVTLMINGGEEHYDVFDDGLLMARVKELRSLERLSGMKVEINVTK